MSEKEYLDREKVIRKLNEIGGCDASDDWEKGFDKAIDTAVKAIEKLPASDVAPVKHGEWQDCNGIFRCSECGYSFEHEGYKHFFHFCPSCGVRMDGEKNET